MFYSSKRVPKLKSRVQRVQAASELGCLAGEAGATEQSCWTGCRRAWTGALMPSLTDRGTSGEIVTSVKEKIILTLAKMVRKTLLRTTAKGSRPLP